MTADQIIKILDLVPLPGEGGYFRETFKSTHLLGAACLPENYNIPHSFSSVIYYLITPESFSAMHKLPTEEIWHFYLGDPAQQIQILPNGEVKQIRIGNQIFDGDVPQVIVPAHCWQGTKLVEGGQFALFATTMSPGFEFSDFVVADKNALIKSNPLFKEAISTYFHT